jgi:hypothetical protein
MLVYATATLYYHALRTETACLTTSVCLHSKQKGAAVSSDQITPRAQVIPYMSLNHPIAICSTVLAPE